MFRFTRDGSEIGQAQIQSPPCAGAIPSPFIVPPSLEILDVPAPGTYAYKLQAAMDDTSGSDLTAAYLKLVACEL